MSAAIQALQQHAEDQRVIVYGESGVGVGWLCRWFHRTTRRRSERLVEVIAQAIVSSQHERALFEAVELARSGTLVVRCFEELAPDLQRRVIASEGTHRLIATCYSNGGNTPARRLSEDILAAFSGVIEVPPLRARSEDLEELAIHLRESFARGTMGTSAPLSAKEIERLRARDWPGNVRELTSVLAVR